MICKAMKNTGLFISPSRDSVSGLDYTITKAAKRFTSVRREFLQVSIWNSRRSVLDSSFDFFLMELHQRSCVCALYATWFTIAARKHHASLISTMRCWDMCVAGTWIPYWRLSRHKRWIY